MTFANGIFTGMFIVLAVEAVFAVGLLLGHRVAMRSKPQDAPKG